MSLLTLEEKAARRFWDKVEISDDLISCWPRPFSLAKFGHSRIGIDKKQWLAHRLSYAMFVGELKPGLFICHHCDNPCCVRPDHLFQGTQHDNIQDALRKGRMPTGERHYSRTSPEKVARGDRSPRRRHPERYPVGEQRKNAKLTEEQVLEILANTSLPYKRLAQKYGVSNGLIGRIKLRKVWKHLCEF